MNKKSEPAPETLAKPGVSMPTALMEARNGTPEGTQHEQTELAVATQQKMFDSLISAIPDLIYFKDRESRFLRINEAYLVRAGIRNVQEALGKTDFDIFGGEHARQAYEDEQRIVATGQPIINKEEREDWPNGRVTWATSTKMPLFDGNGKVIGIMGISRDITERKRVEEALRESEERFSGAFEHAPIGMALVSPEGRWLKVNQSVCDLVGYSELELLTRTFQDITHPDDLAADLEYVRRLLAGEIHSYQMEKRYIHKRGHFITILLNVSLVRDDQGQPLYFISQIQDITEKKQAEEALDYERELWRALLDTSLDFIYFKDTQSRFIKAGKTHARLFGLKSPDEMVGKTDFDFFDDAHARPAFEDEQEIIRTGQPIIAKEEMEVWHDGHVTWASSTKLPMRDAAGKITGIIGLSRDITKSKRAEEELQWKTAFLEAQIDSSSDGIMVLDNEGKRIVQNQRLNELWKIPREIAENPDDNIQLQFVSNQTKNPQQFVERVAYLYSHPEEISQDVIELKDGTILDRSSSPVRDKSGKYYGRICSFRDITETRHLEEQLRQAQKMEAIGQLAGGVAHDFNNILAAIMMEAEMAVMTEGIPEDVRGGLQEIRASAERAANLTRQLLLFSRRQVMQSRNLDLNEVVTNLAKMLQRIIGEDVHLHLHLHSAPLMTRADAGMLEQVLMNLAVNARDAMPEGGRLLIETSEEIVDANAAHWNPDAAPGRYVRLCINDTGSGISPEVLPRIFEPFFTTKGPGKGTGLGLATVFGIVKQHQGWIKVSSEPGRGTRFQIFLPASAATAADPTPEATQSKPYEGTETILLAEDDVAVRRLTRMTLEKRGYKVLEAVDGVDAFKMWKEHRGVISLLLTDVVMPAGMSGQQLARQIQAEKPGLKVVYISGYSAETAGRALELRHGENFVQKPFAPDHLLEIIRRSLDE